jgi:hypothetical protein
VKGTGVKVTEVRVTEVRGTKVKVTEVKGAEGPDECETTGREDVGARANVTS